ncbi:MAG: hypothetical protein IPJ67_00500 [Candidatus Moraniibacteriota bacterium]|nr:MAG: hypothetical protein IPJ67_00500 [Candidatus Moranbacteria bacterium]
MLFLNDSGLSGAGIVRFEEAVLDVSLQLLNVEERLRDPRTPEHEKGCLRRKKRDIEFKMVQFQSGMNNI